MAGGARARGVEADLALRLGVHGSARRRGFGLVTLEAVGAASALAVWERRTLDDVVLRVEGALIPPVGWPRRVRLGTERRAAVATARAMVEA